MYESFQCSIKSDSKFHKVSLKKPCVTLCKTLCDLVVKNLDTASHRVVFTV